MAELQVRCARWELLRDGPVPHATTGEVIPEDFIEVETGCLGLVFVFVACVGIVGLASAIVWLLIGE